MRENAARSNTDALPIATSGIRSLLNHWPCAGASLRQQAVPDYGQLRPHRVIPPAVPVAIDLDSGSTAGNVRPDRASACCDFRMADGDVSTVWSDRCGWTELLAASGDLDDGRAALILGPDWSRRWTTTAGPPAPSTRAEQLCLPSHRLAEESLPGYLLRLFLPARPAPGQNRHPDRPGPIRSRRHRREPAHCGPR